MDLSKEYILMCEKAAELQQLWQPKRGDIVGRNTVFSGYDVNNEMIPTRPNEFTYDCMVITYDGEYEDKPKTNKVLIYYMRNPFWCGVTDGIKRLSEDANWNRGSGLAFYSVRKERLRCLFRQDQLLEMINNGVDLGEEAEFYHWWLTGENFYNSIKKEISQSWFPPKSLEQLLIAYVMLIKFSKTWDGKEWVKS